MNHKTIEFLTEKGQPMTIEARDLRPISDQEELRYKDESRVVYGDTVYEIAKTWADEGSGLLKVWLLRIKELPPEQKKASMHPGDKW